MPRKYLIDKIEPVRVHGEPEQPVVEIRVPCSVCGTRGATKNGMCDGCDSEVRRRVRGVTEIGSAEHRKKMEAMHRRKRGIPEISEAELKKRADHARWERERKARRRAEKLAASRAEGGGEVFVGGQRVDGGGLDIGVACGALDESNVARAPVEVREGRMPKAMEVVVTIEARANLPLRKGVSQRALAEASAKSRHEERRAGIHQLACFAFATQKLHELAPERVGDEALLRDGWTRLRVAMLALDRWALVAALVDAQREAAPDRAPIGRDVADVEREDLVLAKAATDRERDDDVIAEAGDVIERGLEEAELLGFGEGDGSGAAGAEGHAAIDTIAEEEGNDPEVWGSTEEQENEREDREERVQSASAPETKLAPRADGEPRRIGPGLGVIVKRNEQEFADWIATERGFLESIGRYQDEHIRFEVFQRSFLDTQERYRCIEKSRQVGYSWVFGCETLGRAHLRETYTGVFVSYNLADSKEKITYVAQMHEELPLEYQKKKVIDSKLELGFVSNGASKRVSRIISNPSRAPRGKKGDIYLDELAHYKNDREVYKGSTALILRSKGQLTVCSTPLGRRGIFWEIARQEVRPYASYWRQKVPWWLCSFFCTDIREAAQLAPKMTTRERVARWGTKDIKDQFGSLPLEDFQQEFEVLYIDEATSFFPYELILPCCDEELTVAEDATDVKLENVGRLVAGFDVGRKRDLSELAVFEEDGKGRFIERLSMTFERASFEQQETALRRVLNLLPIARLSIDSTGLGNHLAENLSRDYPNVVPEVFTSNLKEIWATDFKILLQQRKIVLPHQRDLIAQIHSIKRAITGGGRVVFESEGENMKGHADKFWARALAVQKERNEKRETEVNMTVIGEEVERANAAPSLIVKPTDDEIGILGRAFATK